MAMQKTPSRNPLEIITKNRRAKIVAMSRRFPPEHKRLWYIVQSKKGYRIRYMGTTIPHYFPSFYGALAMAQTFVQTRVI